MDVVAVSHDLGSGTLPVGTDAHRIAWLPLLGPTAYLLALELARRTPGDVYVAGLAFDLGVRPYTVGQGVKRLVRFRHLRPTGPMGAALTEHPRYVLYLSVPEPTGDPVRRFASDRQRHRERREQDW